MSNRIDRSLGIKPYSQSNNVAPIKKTGFSLKATTVIIWLAIAVAAAGLYSTSHCHAEVRCSDN